METGRHRFMSLHPGVVPEGAQMEAGPVQGPRLGSLRTRLCPLRNAPPDACRLSGPTTRGKTEAF